MTLATALSMVPTHLLEEELAKRIPTRIPEGIRCIVDAVAGTFGIPPQMIFGLSRTAAVSQARHAAWLLVRQREKTTFETIALHFNRGTHCAVIHGCGTARKLLLTDNDFAAKVQQTIATLDATASIDVT